ncbi:HU family DNA-binding protein [Undibacterium arcticum]
MKKIATKHELSKAEAARIIATITETIVATVKKGDTVGIVGFGTFKQMSRAARAGFNPSKGTKNQDSCRQSPEVRGGRRLQGRGRSEGGEAQGREVTGEVDSAPMS